MVAPEGAGCAPIGFALDSYAMGVTTDRGVIWYKTHTTQAITTSMSPAMIRQNNSQCFPALGSACEASCWLVWLI